MSETSNRTQIIVAVIGVIGAIAVAYISNADRWTTSSNGPERVTEQPEPEGTADPLAGFYVRDGLSNSPVMKITPIGGYEYKLEVTNHPWPWEATVRVSGSSISGYGRFPESQATMNFEGQIGNDGSISSEYHFITKGDGSPAEGRIDRHIWTRRTD